MDVCQTADGRSQAAATILQNTPVADYVVNAEGVEITTRKGQVFKAAYLVDGGGFRSIVAEKEGWRRRDLLTHTHGMFTHMIDVPCYHEVSASRQEFDLPFRFSEGTLHHLFKGGWLWVIPFNNHANATNPLCSVGLLLDPRLYPERKDISLEAEFDEFVGQFPRLHAQFKGAKAVRAWVRAPRIQYSVDQVVGERVALLGHAADFIDPLYSKGLYVTHMSVMVLVDLLLDANKTGDYSAEAFALLEEMTLAYIQMHDRLTANSIKLWSHYELWRVYSVQWLLGAYLEYLQLSIARMRARDRSEYINLLKDNRLAGGGYEGFFELQEKIDHIFENVDSEDEADVQRMVAEANLLFEGFSWLPKPFQDILKGKNHLPNIKFRLTLFNKEDGFMGNGAYRQHFFGELSWLDLIYKGGIDQVRYSVPALNRQRRSHNRLTWQVKNDEVLV